MLRKMFKPCHLTVMKSGKREIAKFMSYIDSSYFSFSKLLSQLGYSGNLHIVQNGAHKIRIYKENNDFFDIEFLYKASNAYMIITENESVTAYKVTKKLFGLTLEKVK